MKRLSGFTLVEFLLYIGISAVLLLMSTSLITNMLSGKSKLEAVFEVSQNGRDAMERMRLAIRNANSVTTPADGTTSTMLILQMPFASASPTIFAVQNNVIVMKEGSSASTSLMANDVLVPTLMFHNFGATGTQDNVRITITVSSTNPNNVNDYAFGQSFYGSSAVRRQP
jgi:type II secretory pathway pseudopilin PulG